MAQPHLEQIFQDLNCSNRLKSDIQFILEQAQQKQHTKIHQRFYQQRLIGILQFQRPASQEQEEQERVKKLQKQYRDQIKAAEEEKAKEIREQIIKRNQEKRKREEAKRAREQAHRERLLNDLHTEMQLRKASLNRNIIPSIESKTAMSQDSRTTNSNENPTKRFSSLEAAKRITYERPLYKRLEEKFEKEVLLPQIEERNAVLQQKKEKFRPVRQEEIVDHMKKHDEYIRDLSYKNIQTKSQKALDSQFYLAQVSKSNLARSVIARDKQEKQKRLKEKQERKQLANKRMRYSEIVKEMFSPQIDASKQREMEEIINKSKSGQRLNQSVIRKAGNDIISPQQHKVKKSPLRIRHKKPELSISPKVEQEQPKAKDYLTEMRLARERKSPQPIQKAILEISSDFSENEATSKIYNYDKQIRKHEIFRADMHNYKEMQGVNDMILSSIRAKLSVLDKIISQAYYKLIIIYKLIPHVV